MTKKNILLFICVLLPSFLLADSEIHDIYIGEREPIISPIPQYDPEKNSYPKSKTIGEAFLSKRNLFPSLGKSKNINNLYQNITSYADGKNSIEDISLLCKQPIKVTYKAIQKLNKFNLVEL